MILMRYLIRSLKTFLYFLAIFIIIVAVVVVSCMEEFDIDSLLRDGYKSLVQIFIVLALIAAVYPKVSYAKLFPRINGNLSGNRIQITGLMEEFGYVVENDSLGKMTFRLKSKSARFSRKYEDRVTIEQTENGVSVEGLRKDIVRIVSRMEYRMGE